MALALFLTMGAERYPGRPATTAACRDAVMAFLAQHGIAAPELVHDELRTNDALRGVLEHDIRDHAAGRGARRVGVGVRLE